MFVERKLDMEAVWPATNLSTITMAISTGYFLWDSIVVLVRYDLFGFLFALHGIYCLYVYAAASFVRFDTSAGVRSGELFQTAFFFWPFLASTDIFRYLL